MLNKFRDVKDYRWLKRYLRFIETFKKDSIYKNQKHNHHILPKANYEEFKNFSNNPWNLAILDYRSHLIAHYMLAKALGGNMWFAYNNMNAYGEKLNSILYESAMIRISEEQSIRQTEWLKNNPHPKGMLGKKHGEVQKKTMGKAGLGNSKANGKKVIIMNLDGKIQHSCFRFEIKELSDDLPKRMIEWCLDNKKPMYTNNSPKGSEKFKLWYACYEDEIWTDIDVYFRHNRKKKPKVQKVRTEFTNKFEIYNDKDEKIGECFNKQLKQLCEDNNLTLNQFQYSYRQNKKIKKGKFKDWYCIKKDI